MTDKDWLIENGATLHYLTNPAAVKAVWPDGTSEGVLFAMRGVSEDSDTAKAAYTLIRQWREDHLREQIAA